MRFAVVIVALALACSSRKPMPTPQSAPIDAAAAIDAAAVEADAPAIAVDAAVVDVLRVRCRDVNGPSSRFPKCLVAREPPVKREPIVLPIKRRGEPTDRGYPIIVKGGTNRGIDESWHAELLDAKKRPFSRGQLAYTRLDPDEIEGMTTLHPELVALAKTVRFRPPDSPVSDAEPIVIVIERVEIKDKAVLIVAGGTGYGIATTWRAELVDEALRPLPNGRLAITRFDADAVEGTVKLTKEQAERAKGVRFTPP